MNESTHTVTVTIGRNIGNMPMGYEQWDSFRKAVFSTLHQGGATILQHPRFGGMNANDQVGVWEGERENAAAFVALVTRPESLTLIRERLSMLASLFRQDAIGFIVAEGGEHLVFPKL